MLKKIYNYFRQVPTVTQTEAWTPSHGLSAGSLDLTDSEIGDEVTYMVKTLPL